MNIFNMKKNNFNEINDSIIRVKKFKKGTLHFFANQQMS
ncbi:hypothetical protein RV18_GL001715 [Enterococcus termitis]|nr:hypothetical protein RV18_GL001715 [Enterococcus termitis]